MIVDAQVVEDDEVHHRAFVDFAFPLQYAFRPSPIESNWMWDVAIRDSASVDGKFELSVRAWHRAAPHEGEDPGNYLLEMIYGNADASLRDGSGRIGDDHPFAHGSHADYRQTMIVGSPVRPRLWIQLDHTSGSPGKLHARQPHGCTWPFPFPPPFRPKQDEPMYVAPRVPPPDRGRSA